MVLSTGVEPTCFRQLRHIPFTRLGTCGGGVVGDSSSQGGLLANATPSHHHTYGKSLTLGHLSSYNPASFNSPKQLDV